MSPTLRSFEVKFSGGARTLCAVGPGALAELPALCAQAGLSGASQLVCDARLLELQGKAVQALAAHFGAPLPRPVSEAGKSLAEVEAICNALAARNLGRDSFLLALGGGVLTDLAGLAAALWQRGIPWVAAPSTLLAQVDAGLGGKTGANLGAGKNLVGAFHQPRLVVCDTALLATLPARERWSGLAEVVKCALIAPGEDASGLPLLARCERDLEKAAAGDAESLAALVEASLRVKARIVSADEHEGGARAFLNLGHTVGHALEAGTRYLRFTHGEAVALGLRSALRISRARGLLASEAAGRGLELVSRLQVAADLALSGEERERALEALARDKKARKGVVRFVLLSDLGAPQLEDVAKEEWTVALDALLQGTP
ncbi:MAG TPA: 3-dehydroquinate synthase family protein [Myxococcales bacterium]|nr:3-dehydroquinate synthase family protein [Myxococcales bacterium]